MRRTMLSLALAAGQDWYGAILKEPADLDRHARCFVSWARRRWWNTKQLRSPPVLQPGDNGKLYDQAVRNVARGRRVFAATGCHVGLGPNVLRDGDIVTVLLGGPVPYVLRPLRSGMYYFVGECYVPGYMLGEAVAEWRAGVLKKERFGLK